MLLRSTRSRLFIAAALLAPLFFVVDRVMIDHVRDSAARVATAEFARTAKSAALAAESRLPAREAPAEEKQAALRALAASTGADVVIFGTHGEREAAFPADAHIGFTGPEDGLLADARTKGSAERVARSDDSTRVAHAVRLGDSDRVLYMARELESVGTIGRDAHRALLVWAICAWAAAFFLMERLARRASEGMREVRRSVERLSALQFGGRTNVESGGELAKLGRAVDDATRTLGEQLTSLGRERDALDTVVSNMEEGVLLIDELGHVELVNPASRAMLGLSVEVRGRPLLDVVRHAELKQVIDTAKESQQPEAVEIQTSGITPRRIAVRAAPARGRKGVLAVLTDVTELRRLETMRSDFVANVSHELRTPVTAIRSAAETLHVARDNAQAATQFIGIIDRNAERLHLLIEDILDLSRIESRGYRPAREPIDLGELIAGVLSLFADRADRQNVKLEADVPSQPVVIQSDRGGIEQVLSNLIENAIKYGPGSTVTVRVREGRGEGTTRIEIADTGPGISPKHLPRLFERFYRVDTGRSREVGGTGLGLSIVKHLVDALEGKVQVRSIVGEGTTFTIELPNDVRGGSRAGSRPS